MLSTSKCTPARVLLLSVVFLAILVGTAWILTRPVPLPAPAPAPPQQYDRDQSRAKDIPTARPPTPAPQSENGDDSGTDEEITPPAVPHGKKKQRHRRPRDGKAEHEDPKTREHRPRGGDAAKSQDKRRRSDTNRDRGRHDEGEHHRRHDRKKPHSRRGRDESKRRGETKRKPRQGKPKLRSRFTGAGDPPLPPYYAGIDRNAKGEALRAELTKLINPHTILSYGDLWQAFEQIDEIDSNSTEFCPVGQINDIYSATCWNYPNQQCGSFKKEGSCYNREHSWPKSWWGGAMNAAYTDLFHLWPSDGYDNSIRSNNPLGRVDPNDVAYRTSNGCLSGGCADHPGTVCFEPADKWKGALARSYFYISVAYRDTFDCCDEVGTDGPIIKPWLLETLLDWHSKFPVTQYERDRNEMIAEQLQFNRNPFIDNQQWAASIWK